MRITIVQGAFLPIPPLLGGAVEKVWYGLSREFARLGHNVVHVSRKFGNLPVSETVSGVCHLRVGGFSAPRSLVTLKFYNLIYSLRMRRILPSADVLVTNTFWLPMLVRDDRFGKINVHVQRYPRGQFRFYRHAGRLQTVSTVIAEAVLKECPELAGRVSVIQNPLPATFTVGDRKPRPDREDLELLYVGRIHPEKGLEILIEAFRAFIEKSGERARLRIVEPHREEHGGYGDGYLRMLKR